MPLLVEMGWGGRVQEPWNIVWTDITRRVDQVQGVRIDRGASDELSETQPGSATMRLDNLDGALTPGNPDSPYAPHVRRNAPIRISQVVMPARSGSAPYPLAMLTDTFDDGTLDSSLWTASGGSAEVNGRLRQPVASGAVARLTSARSWVLAGSQSTVKLVTVPAGGGSSSMSVNWYLNSNTVGTRMRWSYNGLTNQLRPTSETAGVDAGGLWFDYSPSEHAWLRIRESSGTVYFETSGDGWDWAVQRTVTTPAWVGTEQVQMDFVATRTGGTADVIEWDLLGGVVRPRFWGVVNEWPVQWEGMLSYVSISATDLFKRINRLPILRSMATHEILLDSPQAFYPLTEAEASSAGNLAATARPALVVTQVGAGGTLELGAADGPPATGERVPLFTPVSATAGKYLSVDLVATIPPSEPGHGGGSGDTLYECWFQTSTQGRVLLSVLDGEPLAFENSLAFSLEAGTGKLKLTSIVNNVTTTSVATTPNLADGSWHHLVYSNLPAVQTAWVDGVSYALASGATVDVRLLHVGSYKGTGLWAGSVAHVAIYADTGDGPFGYELVEHYGAGATGYEGELAWDRIPRLASYAGVTSVTVWGSLHDPLAGQGPAGTAVMARLREVESSESARLFAERDYYGLSYQSRDLRYNPSTAAETFTVSYADLETGDVQLADDDQKLCNQVEGSRPGGAVQLVSDTASIDENGVYGKQLNLIKASDNSVLDAASWIVSRYADPGPELREVPIEAATMGRAFLDILDADISNYFTVYDLPAQSSASEIRCTVEGYSETLKENSHLIQFRTSASSRDSVWILDDPIYSVLGSTTRLAY
ncbi:LamG domain-containing protein [Streptomyces sp. OR43]|uniref:LamG domain-containing protein n=1 Tax=Streptomyces sp. or43 TaxID=2478957 RepID=UPI0011CD75DE|nr:LamG domain-containing protein [Streptomyces sp. or43]TXS36921.1 hypothetical protein EAO72_26400 [Streptomyces sp. or43]